MVMVPLRMFWSKERYQAGSGGHQQDGDHHASKTVQAETVDAGIRSNLFWAYAAMIDIVAECLGHLSSVSEACPCHRGRIFMEGLGRHARRRVFQQRHGVPSCPMATLNAPEFAAGDHLSIIQQLCQAALASVLGHELVRCLVDAERQLVISDFDRARRHIVFNLTLKLNFWKQLPWALFALAHSVTAVARTCCRRALRKFRDAPDATHHWVTRLLCDPRWPGFAAFSAFCEGEAAISESLLLLRMAARFRFAPVAERWIEGRHALTKGHLRASRHHSIVHIVYSGYDVHK